MKINVKTKNWKIKPTKKHTHTHTHKKTTTMVTLTNYEYRENAHILYDKYPTKENNTHKIIETIRGHQWIYFKVNIWSVLCTFILHVESSHGAAEHIHLKSVITVNIKHSRLTLLSVSVNCTVNKITVSGVFWR